MVGSEGRGARGRRRVRVAEVSAHPQHHDEEELYRSHVFHRVDHDGVRTKYSGFYGRVADRQDLLIASYVRGRTVLDAGAGYGWTTRDLRAPRLRRHAGRPREHA